MKLNTTNTIYSNMKIKLNNILTYEVKQRRTQYIYIYLKLNHNHSSILKHEVKKKWTK